jgi:hypothetical protein
MSRMRQYIQVPVHSYPTDVGLNRHRRGLPHLSFEYQIKPLPFLPIQYSPFPLISPPGLILNHSIIYSSSQHSTLEPGYKSPKSREWSLPLDFYWNSIH